MANTKVDPAIRALKNDKAHAHRYKDEVLIEPSSDYPIAPESLSVRAKEIFDEFVERVSQMYSPSDSDLDIMVLYANNQEQLESYEYYLRIEGSTHETLQGPKPRPEIAMYNQCKSLKFKILTEFGMTPASRKKLGIKKTEPKEENPFATLDNKPQLRAIK